MAYRNYLRRPLLVASLFLFNIVAAQYVFPLAGVNFAQGFWGDGANCQNAAFNSPGPLAMAPNGDIYVADAGNARIRMIKTNSIITTVAGTGKDGYSGDGGLATLAKIGAITAMVFDASGNLYFADSSYHCIRMINSNGIITTVAGTGTAGTSPDGATAYGSSINGPGGITINSSGTIYFTETHNHCIRTISTSGILGTVAGTAHVSGFAGDNGQALSASLNLPGYLHFDKNGNLYICDVGNARIRKINTSGVISTFAGNGSPGFTTDNGTATQISINNPCALTSNKINEVYFTDLNNHKLRKVDATGYMSTIVNAGTVTTGNSGTFGQATYFKINSPTGIIIKSDYDIYFSDRDNHTIRMVNAFPGLSVQSNQSDKTVGIFYNTTCGFITVNADEHSELSVYSICGEKVLSAEIEEEETRIETALAPGIYLAVIKSQAGSSVIKKIIAE